MMNIPHHQAHLVTVINDNLFCLCSLNLISLLCTFKLLKLKRMVKRCKVFEIKVGLLHITLNFYLLIYLAWPKEDDLELIQQMNKVLPKDDTMKYDNGTTESLPRQSHVTASTSLRAMENEIRVLREELAKVADRQIAHQMSKSQRTKIKSLGLVVHLPTLSHSIKTKASRRLIRRNKVLLLSFECFAKFCVIRSRP